MIGGVHTGPRALHYPPPGPYLVPAGGLAWESRQWRPARAAFLGPVQARSVVVRAKFRAALHKPPGLDRVPTEVWDQAWVVHGQPVGTGAQALQARAPDLVRVALRKNRILTREAGQVTCQDQDAHTAQPQGCTCRAEACLRRFLPHVLPDHCVKVRSDGVWSPGTREARHTVRDLLGAQSPPSPLTEHPRESTLATTPVHCPRCGHAMELVDTVRPQNRSP